MLNRLLLSLSAGLYCTTFFLSNNWYIYSTNQNVFLIVGGTIICLLAILFSAFIIFFASKVVLRKFKKNIDYDNWHDIAAIGLSLSLCAILLRNTFTALGLSPLIIISLLLPIIIIARSKLKNTVLRKLSYLFLVLTVISFSNFIIQGQENLSNAEH